MKMAWILSLWCAVLPLAAVGCNSGGASNDSGSDSADTATGDAASDDADAASDEVAAVSEPVEIKPGWGNLKGRFTIAGAPAPAEVAITKDEAYCGKFMLKDESLVVGEGAGLANVVVVLSVKRGEAPPEPHESYKAMETGTVLLDNLECRFIPRVVLLRSSQTLEVKNSDPDPIAHNTKVEAENPPINPILAPGATVKQQFKAQRLPAPVSCSIHPWMQAKLVIKDTPYMAASNEKGEFEIQNLPSGKWEFQVWQERLGYVSKVNVGGKDATWSRGQVEAAISGDETTDWGEVKLDFADYKD